MKTLAVDPGYDRCGVAIIESGPEGEKLLYSTCITTDKNKDFSSRLYVIGSELRKLIKKYGPDVLAIEKTFFTKNQKTAIEVSHARGVIMYEASCVDMPVFEYTPPAIKVATTGYGASDKSQIMAMIPKLIKIDKEIRYDDEFDAIAIGLTHLAHQNNQR